MRAKASPVVDSTLACMCPSIGSRSSLILPRAPKDVCSKPHAFEPLKTDATRVSMFSTPLTRRQRPACSPRILDLGAQLFPIGVFFISRACAAVAELCSCDPHASCTPLYPSCTKVIISHHHQRGLHTASISRARAAGPCRRGRAARHPLRGSARRTTRSCPRASARTA